MKIIKKGTKVILKSACNYVGCDEEEEYTLESDMTEEELSEYAHDVAIENIQPNGWFELIEQ